MDGQPDHNQHMPPPPPPGEPVAHGRISRTRTIVVSALVAGAVAAIGIPAAGALADSGSGSSGNSGSVVPEGPAPGFIQSQDGNGEGQGGSREDCPEKRGQRGGGSGSEGSGESGGSGGSSSTPSESL